MEVWRCGGVFGEEGIYNTDFLPSYMWNISMNQWAFWRVGGGYGGDGGMEGGEWVWGKYRGRDVRWAYYVHRDESYLMSTPHFTPNDCCCMSYRYS